MSHHGRFIVVFESSILLSNKNHFNYFSTRSTIEFRLIYITVFSFVVVNVNKYIKPISIILTNRLLVFTLVIRIKRNRVILEAPRLE